jgi:AAA+ ATPase superfamily predicted ATPase
MARFLLDNPFLTTTYNGKQYFCDREKETDSLIKKLFNGNSITLISQRRIGKTGLIHHVLNQLPKKYTGIYLDILETDNLNQLFNQLATSIIKVIPEKSGVGKVLWKFIKSLRPVISFDSLSGTPQFSFDMKQTEIESNIQNIFQLLDNQDFKTVIAIDEFQQILKYPEKNTDAWLRSRIQQRCGRFGRQCFAPCDAAIPTKRRVR